MLFQIDYCHLHLQYWLREGPLATTSSTSESLLSSNNDHLIIGNNDELLINSNTSTIITETNDDKNDSTHYHW